MTLQDRFESKYVPEPNTGCWLWIAAVNEKGYGLMGLGSRKDGLVKAHRLSYEIYKGKIPAGLSVMHLCNTPSCVNPNHLMVGTQKDNMSYMVSCGRLKFPDNRGEKSSSVKITEKEAKEILATYQFRKKGTGTDLAKKYGIHKSTVYQIWAGKNWKHLSQQ